MLVTVLAKFISMTASSEIKTPLQVLCIRYSGQFYESQAKAKTLINSGGKVNAIGLAYARKLGFTSQKISIRAQKIDGLALETYGMVSVSFLLQDSLGKIQFFKKTFLLANNNMKVVLRMHFFF